MRNFATIASKHIPFAVAKTLTQIATAKVSKKLEKASKKNSLSEKSPAVLKVQFESKAGNKTKLTAEVYTMAAFAALQQNRQC